MTSRRKSWLRSPYGWTGYAIGWLTFGAGFAAAFWMGRPDLARAARAATLVVLPAALLGLAVVGICDRLPMYERRRPWLPFVHVLLALTFSACWIGGLWLLNQAVAALGGQPPPTSLPPSHILHWHLFAGSLLYAVLASVTFGYRHAMAAERDRRAAELRLLQAQLNPHFLFNTLHSIFALTRADPGAGERALDTFTQMLRYVLQVHREGLELVLFEDEWAFTRRYLDLEQLRLQDRLRVSASIDDDVMDCAIPPLLLQPIVENAVKHGIAPRPEGGGMEIIARRDGRHILLTVTDDGAGSSSDVWTSPGLGLRSIRTRIHHIFEGEAQCTVAAGPTSGFRVTLQLPVQHTAARAPRQRS